MANWWRGFLDNIGWRKATTVDLLTRKVAELPTSLPPDRPPNAAPDELFEAAQEFLDSIRRRRQNLKRTPLTMP